MPTELDPKASTSQVSERVRGPAWAVRMFWTLALAATAGAGFLAYDRLNPNYAAIAKASGIAISRSELGSYAKLAATEDATPELLALASTTTVPGPQILQRLPNHPIATRSLTLPTAETLRLAESAADKQGIAVPEQPSATEYKVMRGVSEAAVALLSKAIALGRANDADGCLKEYGRALKVILFLRHYPLEQVQVLYSHELSGAIQVGAYIADLQPGGFKSGLAASLTKSWLSLPNADPEFLIRTISLETYIRTTSPNWQSGESDSGDWVSRKNRWLPSLLRQQGRFLATFRSKGGGVGGFDDAWYEFRAARHENAPDEIPLVENSIANRIRDIMEPEARLDLLKIALKNREDGTWTSRGVSDKLDPIGATYVVHPDSISAIPTYCSASLVRKGDMLYFN